MIVLICIDTGDAAGMRFLCVGPFETKEEAIDHVLGTDTKAREEVRAENEGYTFKLNEMVYVACEVDTPIDYIPPGTRHN